MLASLEKSTIVFYPNDGNGGFSTAVLVGFQTRPNRVEVADMDGDGDQVDLQQ